MCYYNGIKISRADFEWLQKAEAFGDEMIRKVQSGFDYDNWPIILDQGSGWEGALAHWEFIPYWVSSIKQVAEYRQKFTTLNAKGETLLSSKMYAEAARKRRCLVLSSGFYEWRHYKKKTYPHYITLKDRSWFYMAGIWQPWTDRETGEHVISFSLVTTAANTLMEQIHNTKKRMPVILTEELARDWMRKDLTDGEITRIGSYQLPPSLMQACTVRKDFREALDPEEAFKYEDLPPLSDGSKPGEPGMAAGSLTLF